LEQLLSRDCAAVSLPPWKLGYSINNDEANAPQCSAVMRQPPCISRDQAKQAINVARIPADELHEALIESDNPPTITALAWLAAQKKPQPLVDVGDNKASDNYRCCLGLVSGQSQQTGLPRSKMASVGRRM
jgi:hypothetical protein